MRALWKSKSSEAISLDWILLFVRGVNVCCTVDVRQEPTHSGFRSLDLEIPISVARWLFGVLFFLSLFRYFLCVFDQKYFM